MSESNKGNRTISATMEVRGRTQKGEENIFYVSTGSVTEDQIEELEQELFFGHGPPDNPDSPRYIITIKNEDDTERQIMVTQFRIYEDSGSSWEIIGWTTPELRQKLAKWSSEWPKEKDTTHEDFIKQLMSQQKASETDAP